MADLLAVIAQHPAAPFASVPLARDELKAGAAAQHSGRILEGPSARL
jgi:hypothetical protein